MSYITTINEVPFEALARACQFVKEKYNLDRGRIISEEFENEFGIKIHYRNDILSMQDDVEFPSEQDYLLFIIRWS